MSRDFADAVLMCDWSPQGNLYAAGGQDGRCLVWDVRDRRAVARYLTHSAVRCVKFSSGPMDLLAFAESEGRVHLVDIRMLDHKQVPTVMQRYGNGSSQSKAFFVEQRSH